VLAAHGNEAPPWLHAATVVIQSVDRRIAALVEVFGTIQQLQEVHSTGIIAALRSDEDVESGQESLCSKSGLRGALVAETYRDFLPGEQVAAR